MNTFTAFLAAMGVAAYFYMGYRVAMAAFRNEISEYRKSRGINWSSNWRLIARNKGFPLYLVLLWPHELARAVVFFVEMKFANRAIELEERENDDVSKN